MTEPQQRPNDGLLPLLALLTAVALALMAWWPVVTYADGAPAAALGSRGVSTPPNHVLAHARQTPDPAGTAPQGATRAVELAHTNGLDR
jgi:hypothetical protein